MVRKVRIRPVESGVGKILSGVGVAKPSQALEQTHLIGASDLQRWVAPCWNMASCLSTRRKLGTTALRAFPWVHPGTLSSKSWFLASEGKHYPNIWNLHATQTAATLSESSFNLWRETWKFMNIYRVAWVEGNQKKNRKKTRQSFLAVQYGWDPFSGVVVNMMNMETVNNILMIYSFTICLLISLLSLHIITIISYHYWWWGSW